MDTKRAARYTRLATQLRELIEGKSPTLQAAMATICAILHAKLPHHFWTGFYFVASESELHVGPYQGPVACQILKDRGVCIEAMRTQQAVIVKDVHAFPGHIACDSRSKSEIAIPVLKGDQVVAVFDVDSSELGQFGEQDNESLTRILNLLTPYL